MNEMGDQEMYEAEKEYLRFFSEDVIHMERLRRVLEGASGRTLVVDINRLRTWAERRVTRLLGEHGMEEMTALTKALGIAADNLDPRSDHTHDLKVGLEGSFGHRHLTPRTLGSVHTGGIVCVEGIVTRMSSVRSKLERSVHYCPATKKHSERRYYDITSLEPQSSFGAYPTKDDQGNVLETEYGLCVYKDHQTFTIQEMPEHTPAGQLPRFTEVILENDLIDTCKAGDRVYVTGQYRVIAGKKGGYTTASFRSILIANNVYPFTKQASSNFNDADLKKIVDISKSKDILDILTRSVAPSISGHEFIKRAILCQLLGGVERILINGTRIRGDINLLLLGDPSVAKSQFLRFVLQCARDRAVATTGRGSSGVGLTAAVVTDRESGEKNLEAGAMVLADRGIVCIDEFDKMSDIDRTAIHEVMEQGRVTIAKAGIQAKLNARCSVLAAANPVYGQYDQYKTPMENIGLQDSLLSRFDLLFIVLDQIDKESDRALADFVLRIHQYRAHGEEDGFAMNLQATHNVEMVGSNANNENDTNGVTEGQVFEDSSASTQKRFFTKEFFEKYIQAARQLTPKLSKEASKILVDKYCDLRAQENEMAENGTANNRHRTQPVTARTLETLIRLATAHAKGRFKKVVSSRDAEAAVALVSFVMFKEVLKKSSKRAKPDDENSGDDSEGEEEVEPVIDDLTTGTKPKRMKLEISEAELLRLTKLVSDVFSKKHETDLPVAEIMTYVREQTGGQMSESLVKEGLQKLHDMNRLMLADDHVYTI